MPTFVVAALYKFVRIDDVEGLRKTLLAELLDLGVRGTILVAPEGINGTIAGSRSGIDRLLEFIRSDPRFEDLNHKESFTDRMPFLRTKVRLKKEIVALGSPEADPTVRVGTYVTPADWNRLISDPDVTLIDTRNDYEVHIGSFRGAVNPHTNSFRDFPDYVDQNLDPSRDRKIAMFCTGGIRCEKATSLLLSRGFEEVYHLEGGILKYLEEVPEDDTMWQGECFVFDDRVTVDHGLRPGSYDLCHACRMPLSDEDKKSPKYIEGASCPYCFDARTDDDRERYLERERQMKLADAHGRVHLGPDAGAELD